MENNYKASYTTEVPTGDGSIKSLVTKELLLADSIWADLEKEIHKYVDIPDNQGLPEKEDLRECAKYFAVWGMNHAKCKED